MNLYFKDENNEETASVPVQTPHDPNFHHPQLNEYGDNYHQKPNNGNERNNYNNNPYIENNNFPHNHHGQNLPNYNNPHINNNNHNNIKKIYEQQPFNFHTPPTDSESKNRPRNSSPNSIISNLHYISIIFYMYLNI